MGARTSFTSPRASRNQIQFDWKFQDNEGVGYVDALGKFVWLNQSNKYVAGLVEEKRRPELFMLIASMLADHHCRHDRTGQTLLAFNYDNFSDSLGSIIKGLEGAKHE